jgi:hypothetical protein
MDKKKMKEHDAGSKPFQKKPFLSKNILRTKRIKNKSPYRKKKGRS